ncbi:AMP-dependent synthetase/ligase [Gemmatimonas groenlandica]|uniref:Long-chain fatty acid--CoA ligase n=1 Tax=Gemmatimonas groenlandica TaxID=2732249 RepID=A0A6M4IMK4_9BACT|nr:AMP-dependent synthetase/ligase [Gemmatimonas groenlandica]QJR34646.1 long-chain fatty acid--CoA ligase [Gemmatimonas groenlandica]
MATASTDTVAIMAETPLALRFLARCDRFPDSVAYAVYPTGARTPSRVLTWGEWRDASLACAARLLAAGIEPGDRVAILAGNRLLWPVVDVALQLVRAVGVGLYPTSAPAQIVALLQDSGARLLFTDSVAHVAEIRAASDPAVAGIAIVVDAARDGEVVPFTAWCDEGARLLRDRGATTKLEARIASLVPDDVAALIYTSGSTGEPKGACISHRYLAASAASIAEVLRIDGDDRSVSFLPYSHAAERIFGQCTRMLSGMSAALVEDPTDVFRVCEHFQPTVFGGLPRLFERLYEATEIARATGSDPRDAISSRIGPDVRLATSGGAALPQRVAETLDALGLPILGAYGQTEHLCIAMNRVDAIRFDTVGTPMPGTTVRIADDGELLVLRSALTFSGYWNKPDDTRAAFTDDGLWLRTGDQAALEADGALRITGRVKELIALSTGRKIAPLPIEAALTDSPFVAHAVCHGEGRKFPVALLALRRDMVTAWATAQQLSLPWSELTRHAALHALVQEQVDRVNAALARTDRIQSFAITDAEFSVAGGELTPTLKLVRRVIDTRFAPVFDALYAAAARPTGDA